MQSVDMCWTHIQVDDRKTGSKCRFRVVTLWYSSRALHYYAVFFDDDQQESNEDEALRGRAMVQDS